MDYFVSQLQIPGFDPFRRPAQALPVSGAANDVVFAFSTAGASAIARETNDGFVVLSGSTARRGATETFPAGYRALRDQLLAEGPWSMSLQQDYIASSPTRCLQARVLLLRSSPAAVPAVRWNGRSAAPARPIATGGLPRWDEGCYSSSLSSGREPRPACNSVVLPPEIGEAMCLTGPRGGQMNRNAYLASSMASWRVDCITESQRSRKGGGHCLSGYLSASR